VFLRALLGKLSKECSSSKFVDTPFRPDGGNPWLQSLDSQLGQQCNDPEIMPCLADLLIKQGPFMRVAGWRASERIVAGRAVETRYR